MNKIKAFSSKREVISLSRRSGFIYKQCVKFSNTGDLNASGNRRGMNSNSQRNLNKGAINGFGEYSRRNLGKCTDIFFWSCRKSAGLNPITKKQGYLAAAFITLTIPDCHEIIDSKKGYDKLIKEFVRWLAKRFSVTGYIWKFEWQERGQGHWHLFVDKYCDIAVVKKHWNRSLHRLGLNERFENDNGYESPYECTIKGMRDESELQKYLEKYMSKSYQNKKTTEGRTWGASMWIKKAEKPRVPITAKFEENLATAIRTGAFMEQRIEIESKNDTGELAVGVDGKIKSVHVGTAIWSNKFQMEWLLCDEQRKWYNRYISAYRRQDWKATWYIGYDFDKIAKDYGEYTESKEYIENERERLIERNRARYIGRKIEKKKRLKIDRSTQIELGV